jgi:ABC-type transport system involved in multi-copper enzyme maturation permease subunit
MIVAALWGFAIAIGTEPAGEVETRFFDLVLARPVPRALVVARSILLILLLPAIVIGVMMAATLLAVRWGAPAGSDVPARLIASLALNLWMLVECAGGMALAVASVSRRRATAAGLVGVAMLALFFVDYVARVWPAARSIVWLSPFHYFDAMAMVMGQPLPGSFVRRRLRV